MNPLNDNPPPSRSGCLWATLLLLVTLLIGYGRCSNLHLGSH